jgi:hypothetical protein
LLTARACRVQECRINPQERLPEPIGKAVPENLARLGCGRACGKACDFTVERYGIIASGPGSSSFAPIVMKSGNQIRKPQRNNGF